MSLADRILGEVPHSSAPETGEPPRTALGNIDFGGRRLDKVPEFTSYLAGLENDYQLPKGLLGSVMRAESAGQNDARSPKGARGAFQFMPATAAEYGIDPLDPVQAADGAARYLRKSLDRFGNLPEAVASYNAGPGRIAKTGVKGAPRETRDYVGKVLNFLIPAAEAAESEMGPAPSPAAPEARSFLSDRILGGGDTGKPAPSERAPDPAPQPTLAEPSPSVADPMTPENRPSLADRILGGADTSASPPQVAAEPGKFTLVDQKRRPEGGLTLSDLVTGPQRTMRTVEAPGPATPGPAPEDAKTISQMGRPYRYVPERAAPSSLIAKASFADDPKFRIPLYAKARGISPDSYQIIDGRPAYRAKDDGNWYFEEPPDGWTDPIDSFGEFADRTAGNAGPAIPAAAGTTASILTFPAALTGVGIAGTVGATAGAQAGGELIRQGIGNWLTDEDVDLGRVAEEGAYGAAGQLVPTVAVRAGRGLYERIPTVLKNIPRTERARIDAPAAADLAAKAKDKDIRLTPAELANSPSMKAEQKYLSNMPQSADRMGDYYQGRAIDIDNAVDRELAAISGNDSTELAGGNAIELSRHHIKGTREAQALETRNAVDRQLAGISPNDSAELAGGAAIGTSKEAIRRARQARSAEARPRYEAVVNERSVLDEGQFGPVAGDPYLMERIAAVKSSKLHGMQDLPDQSLPVLDEVKKDLDDLIDVARRGGEQNKARLLSEKRAKLLEATDTAFPDYPAARAAFAGDSPKVDFLEKGVVGQIAKLKDTDARDAVDRLLSASRIGPVEASQARQAIEKTDPEAWQSVKRAWLNSQWDEASKGAVTDGTINAGPKFSERLMGDPKQREILEAVLSPEEFKGLKAVFEADALPKPSEGVVGQIAKLKDTDARDAVDRLISASRIGPLEASRAREVIEGKSPFVWQGVKRAWLSSQWDRASKETLADGALNAGPKFRKLLMGDPEQRKVLETVLSKDEFKSLSDLSDVLEAAGRVKPIGSDTAWNQEMQRLAKEAATPALAKLARIGAPHKWHQFIEDGLTRWNLGRQANKLVEVITSPDAAAELARLRQMPPGSARWAVGVTKILEDVGLFDEARTGSRK